MSDSKIFVEGLRSCGIRIKKQAVRELDYLDGSDFPSFLAEAGSQFDETDDWRSNDVFTLDLEWINEADDYLEIIQRLSALGGFRVKSRVSVIEEGSVYKIVCAGLADFALKANDDWVDLRVLEWGDERLIGCGSMKRFAVSDFGVGQDVIIVCLTPEHLRKLNAFAASVAGESDADQPMKFSFLQATGS